jgi:hypothetical protein
MFKTFSLFKSLIVDIICTHTLTTALNNFYFLNAQSHIQYTIMKSRNNRKNISMSIGKNTEIQCKCFYKVPWAGRMKLPIYNILYAVTVMTCETFLKGLLLELQPSSKYPCHSLTKLELNVLSTSTNRFLPLKVYDLKRIRG